MAREVDVNTANQTQEINPNPGFFINSSFGNSTFNFSKWTGTGSLPDSDYI